tara:strand:+ start:288 stop:776 length:489 start_codon:yes stop_codon:yes gene_type:complete
MDQNLTYFNTQKKEIESTIKKIDIQIRLSKTAISAGSGAPLWPDTVKMIAEHTKKLNIFQKQRTVYERLNKNLTIIIKELKPLIIRGNELYHAFENAKTTFDSTGIVSTGTITRIGGGKKKPASKKKKKALKFVKASNGVMMYFYDGKRISKDKAKKLRKKK